MEDWIEQIKEACRQQPTRTKWVFVPSSSIAWTIGERLVLDGCNWLNLRLTTLGDFVTEECAAGLLEQGLEPCPERLGPALMLSLIEGDEVFESLAEQPGMAQALWSSLQEVRLAGLSCADLQRCPPRPELRSFATLVQRYEQYLAERGWLDRAGLLQSPATVQLMKSQDLYWVFPHQWSALEVERLRILPGQLQQPVARTGTIVVQPRTEERLETSPDNTKQNAGRDGRRQWKRSFARAVGRRAEVEAMLEAIRTQGLPADEVEFTGPAEDVAEYWDVLNSQGFGCTFARGLPASVTRVGQAVLGLVSCLEQNWSAFHLRTLLHQDLICAPPSGRRAALLLEKAQIRSGREAYRLHLTRLQHGQETLEGLEQFRQWIEQFLWRFPDPNQTGPDPASTLPRRADWLDGLLETVRQDIHIRCEEDGEDRKSLLRGLEELRLLPNRACSAAAFALLVRQRLSTLHTRASRPVAGKIHFTSPELLGLSGRPQAWWLGMQQGKVEPRAIEDCLVTDADRSLLGSRMLGSESRRSQQQAQILERLAQFPGHLHLSYSTCGQTPDQTQMPDWQYLLAAKQQLPEVENLESFDTVIPLFRPRLQQFALEAVLQAFANLAQGERADVERRSNRFSIYDGWVPAAAGLLDPRRPQPADVTKAKGEPSSALPPGQEKPLTSASSLQKLANCPYQTFLERALKIQPDPLEQANRDVWLDPLEKGSLLHDVFAIYGRQLRQEQRPARPSDASILEQILEEQLDSLRQVLPPPHPATEKRECQTLRLDLASFLRLELAQPERKILACEVPFGMGPEPQESLTLEQAIEIDTGEHGSIRLRGRIDRIDQIEERFQVVDYKTGRKLNVSDRSRQFDQGNLLQHTLYAQAVAKMLQISPDRIGASYLFPSFDSEQARWELPPSDPQKLQELLHWLLEPLRLGTFTRTESDDHCTYCKFKACCRPLPAKYAKAKIKSPSNQQLESRRQLKNYP